MLLSWWLQCSLPPVLGGIGVRSLSLADQLHYHDLPDLVMPMARQQWHVQTELSDPPGHTHRSCLATPLYGAKERLVGALRTSRDVGRLHYASTTEAAAVNRGLPCSRDSRRHAPHQHRAADHRGPASRPAFCCRRHLCLWRASTC